MNILLTGGTGYIGSHTATALCNAGCRVVLYDNLSNSSSDVVEKLYTITKKKVHLVKGDVRSEHLLFQTLKKYEIDAVIHFAGLKSVQESIQKAIEYYSVNIQGSISLLRAMESSKVHVLVFSSSATVYGSPEYLPVDEEHTVNASSPYGRTKLYIEEMLKDLAASNAKWKIVCLRYFNPVGAHESGLISDVPQGLPDNLMPYISQVAAGHLPYVNVYGKDYPTHDGTGIRDYIHVMDLAQGHIDALHFVKDAPGVDVFNLGTGNGYSVLEIIRCYEQASGMTIPFQYAHRRPNDVPSCYANPEKASRYLGWKARYGIHEMCRSSWKSQIINNPKAGQNWDSI